MDPQAAWDQLLEAYTHGDRSVVVELAEGLLEWLHRGGFTGLEAGHGLTALATL